LHGSGSKVFLRNEVNKWRIFNHLFFLLYGPANDEQNAAKRLAISKGS